jgi:hypothetical protein
MKLAQLQEARYHKANYLGWVNDLIDKTRQDNEMREKFIPIAPNDADVALKQISDYYGKPHHQTFVGGEDESERQYYLWQNDPASKPSFNIILWPQMDEIAVQTFHDLKAI